MKVVKVPSRETLGVAMLAAGAVALALTMLLTQRAAPSRAGAADHLDAPGLTPPGGDRRLDITDVYAFQSPANSANTVLVMNVNPLSSPGQDETFASRVPRVHETRNAAYVFHVDNDGDAVADVDLGVRFGQPKRDGSQAYEVSRNGAVLIPMGLARTEDTITRDGVSAFAGKRDDPFFFDLAGFLDILGPGTFIGCTTPRTDFFAGKNVSSIVLELPSSLLTADSSNIGVWGATTLGSAQVDRMGRPAIATVFIPNNPFEPVRSEASLKNTYNHNEPVDDQANFRSEVVDTLTLLFSLNDPPAGSDDPSDDAAAINGLANVLLPDILTVDVSNPAGFLNGRKLADDVIDAELNLVTEGAVTTDCVSANDKTFPSSFPYLAGPH